MRAALEEHDTQFNSECKALLTLLSFTDVPADVSHSHVLANETDACREGEHDVYVGADNVRLRVWVGTGHVPVVVVSEACAAVFAESLTLFPRTEMFASVGSDAQIDADGDSDGGGGGHPDEECSFFDLFTEEHVGARMAWDEFMRTMNHGSGENGEVLSERQTYAGAGRYDPIPRTDPRTFMLQAILDDASEELGVPVRLDRTSSPAAAEKAHACVMEAVRRFNASLELIKDERLAASATVYRRMEWSNLGHSGPDNAMNFVDMRGTVTDAPDDTYARVVSFALKSATKDALETTVVARQALLHPFCKKAFARLEFTDTGFTYCIERVVAQMGKDVKVKLSSMHRNGEMVQGTQMNHWFPHRSVCNPIFDVVQAIRDLQALGTCRRTDIPEAILETIDSAAGRIQTAIRAHLDLRQVLSGLGESEHAATSRTARAALRALARTEDEVRSLCTLPRDDIYAAVMERTRSDLIADASAILRQATSRSDDALTIAKGKLCYVKEAQVHLSSVPVANTELEDFWAAGASAYAALRAARLPGYTSSLAIVTDVPSVAHTVVRSVFAHLTQRCSDLAVVMTP